MLYLHGVFYCYNEIENVISSSVTVIAKQILVFSPGSISVAWTDAKFCGTEANL